MRSILKNLNLVFDSEWVASVDDLHLELDFYQPHVVHFIGYDTRKGLTLPMQIGETELAHDHALSILFGQFSKRIRLVILDNCYLHEQALALTENEVVDYIIGINDSTDTGNSLHFTSLIYSHMSRGASIQGAFNQVRQADMSVSTHLALLRNKHAQEVILLPPDPLFPPEEIERSVRVVFEESSRLSNLLRPEPIDLFIAYAHEDQEWRDRLMKHLSLLRNQELINVWHDGNVSREKEWQQSIEHFNKAQVILLLISPDFIASDFSRSDEMKRAIERHRLGEAYVIPVILRPVIWEAALLANLPGIRLPRDGKPITEKFSSDEAFAEVVRGVRLVIEELQKNGSTPPPQPPVELQPADQPEMLGTSVVPRYNLDQVFVRAGVPDATFVESKHLEPLKFALMQKGRSVVIEGPSGIGKTTALQKALKEIQATSHTLRQMEKPIMLFSALNPADLEQLKRLTLENWLRGTLVIDDFHHLDAMLSRNIAHYLKLLADNSQEESRKLVLVGIPHSGQSLVDGLYDLATRIDVFRLGKVKNELVQQMIEKGEKALNIFLERKAEIVLKAGGSLNIAQFLCFSICQQEGVYATQEQPRSVYSEVGAALTQVQADFSTKFGSVTERFAALGGPSDNTCLRLLEELSASEEGLLSLARLKESKYELAHGIDRFINEEWLERLYQELPDSKNYLFFQQSTSAFQQSTFTLVSDDPQFTFYLKNISFSELTRKVKKIVAFKRQLVFLCYCNNQLDTRWLEYLQIHLKPLTREGSIELWDITQIPLGDVRANALRQAIETAVVAIPLVSSDFLADDSIMDDQLSRLLAQARSGGTTIIPLITRPCQFKRSGLGIFQPVNSPDRPLSRMRKVEWETTLARLAEAVGNKLDSI
jgi:hypothetical protein